MEKNLILTERRRSKEKGDEPTTYRLNIIGETRVNNHTPRGVKNTPGGGVENTPPPSDKNYTTQETDLQEIVDNTVNGVVKGGEGNNLQKLQDLDQPKEKTAYVAQFLLEELGDKNALSTALQKMDIHNKLLFLGRLCKSLVISKIRAIMRPSMR